MNAMPPSPTPATLRFELRIDWSEIDAYGHINNLAIQRYVQSARVHYLERIGMFPVDKALNLGPVLASTSCQFRRQLHYPGTVRVESWTDHVGGSSFHMRHHVFNGAGELVAEAHDVLVMFDFTKNAKHAIPDVFRERIAALEG